MGAGHQPHRLQFQPPFRHRPEPLPQCAVHHPREAPLCSRRQEVKRGFRLIGKAEASLLNAVSPAGIASCKEVSVVFGQHRPPLPLSQGGRAGLHSAGCAPSATSQEQFLIGGNKICLKLVEDGLLPVGVKKGALLYWVWWSADCRAWI